MNKPPPQDSPAPFEIPSPWRMRRLPLFTYEELARRVRTGTLSPAPEYGISQPPSGTEG